MGSLAQLAKQRGFRVTGCDTSVYPPMSTQLRSAGIEVVEGFGEEQLALKPDLFVIGNVVSRGNPLMEAILNRGLAYTSGPQWLSENVLRGRWVLAVAGTHGKTTTTSMLAWILEFAGFTPGYLIGGVAQNFSESARLGQSDFFVIEADEYDTAFFDKRSKFLHYQPRTLILNNLEFDHADIFPDLGAIQKQFEHLLRLVPDSGLVISPIEEKALNEVIAKGCWAERQTSGIEGGQPETNWSWQLEDKAENSAAIKFNGNALGTLRWDISGMHNLQNALHAIAAARHVGIDPGLSIEALGKFKGVKRRLEFVGSVNSVSVYDDFAHHPSAIDATLKGFRTKVGDSREIIAVIEPRSNTMKQGVHKKDLLSATQAADKVFWFEPEGLGWNLREWVERNNDSSLVFPNHELLIERVISAAGANSAIIVMSNGGFYNVPRKLVEALQAKAQGEQ